MSKVLLGDVAVEHKETCKGSKDGYPIVGLEHLIPEEITLTAWNEGSENTFSKMFRKGNVLFGRRRAYLKKAAVAPFDGICSGDITVIEAKPDRILPELLPFIIQNDDLFEFAVGKSAGSLSPRVKWEHLKNYEFELPDMEKQKELAELLWAMDNTKKSYQKLIVATDELVKSQFMEQFSDVKKRETLEALSINGPQNGFYRKADGSVPNTHIVKMKELFANECIADETSFDMVNMTPNEQKRFELTPDDLLFGRRSLVVEGAGKCRRVGDITLPLAFESSLLRITLDTERVLPRFVQAWFDTDEGRRAIISIRAVTTISGIKGSDLKRVLIPVPTLEQQECFLAFVRQSDKSKFAALSCSNLNLSGQLATRISPVIPLPQGGVHNGEISV